MGSKAGTNEFSAVSFEDIESEPNEFANVDWSVEELSAPEDTTTLTDIAADALKAGASEIGDWLIGKGKTSKLVRSAFSRAITVPARMTEMALQLGEDIEYGVRGGYQQLTGKEVDPPVHAASEYVGRAATGLEEMIQPEDMGRAENIAAKMGEYAGFSGIINEKAIHAGQELLKAVPKNPTMIEQMFMDVAKNPKLARILDQKVTAIMAAAGGAAEEVLDTSPMTTLAIEMIAGLSSSGILKLADSTKNAINRMWRDNEKLASRAAGKYLADVEAEIPGFQQKLSEGEKLSRKYGVEMDVSEMAGSRELKAAKEHLVEEVPGGAEAEIQRQARQETQVRNAFQADESVISRGMDDAQKQLDKTAKTLEAQTAKADELARIEARPYADLDTTETGKAILYKIDDAEAVVDKQVKAAYSKVGLDAPVKTDIIDSSIREAKKSRLPGNEWRGELSAQLTKIFKRLQGEADEGVKELGTVKKIRIGRGEKKPKELTVGAVQELQSQLKQEIRTARSQGKDSLVRSLKIVLDGTFKQLDNVTGVSAKSVQDLKAANRMARESFERFDNARVDILTRVDPQGITKTAPEDIVRNVVKADSGTNVERSVESVMDAIGNPKESVELLKKAFMSKLAMKSIKDGRLTPKSTEDFLRSHRKFLKASGLDKEFKDPAKRAKAFEDSMANMQNEISALGKSEMAKWVASDDPVKFIMSSLQSGKIKHLMASSSPLVQRAIRETVWEGILRDAGVKKGLMGFEKPLNSDTLSTLIQKNKKDLVNTLGDEHFKYVSDLFKIMKRIKPDAAKTAGFVTDKGMADLNEKLLTGLRAAAHGFVRPDLIVAQAAKRGWEAKSLKESKKLLKEALVNKEQAKQLLKIYRSSPEGKVFVQTSLSPFVTSVATESTGE